MMLSDPHPPIDALNFCVIIVPTFIYFWGSKMFNILVLVGALLGWLLSCGTFYALYVRLPNMWPFFSLLVVALACMAAVIVLQAMSVFGRRDKS